jgi:hypothetical protein
LDITIYVNTLSLIVIISPEWRNGRKTIDSISKLMVSTIMEILIGSLLILKE